MRVRPDGENLYVLSEITKRPRWQILNQVNEILRDIASFGKNEDGSYTRTCYSPEYFEAATAVEKQMKSLGMKTEWDAAGNIHGIYREHGQVQKAS